MHVRPKYDHRVLHWRPATSIWLKSTSKFPFMIHFFFSSMWRIYLPSFGKYALENICHTIIRKCMWDPNMIIMYYIGDPHLSFDSIYFKVSAYDSFLLQLPVKDLLAFGKSALEKICHKIIRKCIWEPCFAQPLHVEQNNCQVGGEHEAYDGNPNFTHFEKHVVKNLKYV